MRYIVSMVAIGSIAASVSAGTNILQNAGFETGILDPWFQDVDFGGIEDWNVTDADAHTGTYSATDQGNKSIRQNFAPIATEDIVELSFWLKQPEAQISFITLYYSDGSDGGQIVSLTSGAWEFFNVTSFLDAGKELTGFGMYGYSSDGVDDRTYMDDAVLMVIPAPGILAALGVFGLCGSRRRRSA